MKIAVIGLGYVGLPLLNAFSKHYETVGFDINTQRIRELSNGHDSTLELSKTELNKCQTIFTSEIEDLESAKIFIITVPTPIKKNNLPDLSFVINASTIVGKVIKKNNVVVYESTVYPGATEEVFVPALEKNSGLKANRDFFYGYSPERINPGDNHHKIEDIMKVVSGSNQMTTKLLKKIYSKIIKAGIHLTSNIKVAEAAKVIENTQRDLNIAFVNELSIIFNKMNIDTEEVLAAAETKWNFHPYRPGLVGGHCIGVDPYYLTYKSNQLGIDPKIILSGRNTNNNMPKYVVDKIIKRLNEKKQKTKNLNVLILGLTFKNDCPDTRNSQVFKIIDILKKKNNEINVYDPWVKNHFSKKFTLLNKINQSKKKYNVIIIAVDHKIFKQYKLQKIKKLMSKNGIIFDVKKIYKKYETDLSL